MRDCAVSSGCRLSACDAHQSSRRCGVEAEPCPVGGVCLCGGRGSAVGVCQWPAVLPWMGCSRARLLLLGGRILIFGNVHMLCLLPLRPLLLLACALHLVPCRGLVENPSESEHGRRIYRYRYRYIMCYALYMPPITAISYSKYSSF